jgi:primase-polymerase (primpol)-like protein
MSAIKSIHPDFHPNLETFDPEYKKGAQSERNAEASRPREDQFGLLMAGKMQDAGFDDHSRADFRLCQILTRTCNGNRALMDQMFRQSGLMREKWDEQHGSDTGLQCVSKKPLPKLASST